MEISNYSDKYILIEQDHIGLFIDKATMSLTMDNDNIYLKWDNKGSRAFKVAYKEVTAPITINIDKLVQTLNLWASDQAHIYECKITTGAIDGINNEFIFDIMPVLIFANGLKKSKNIDYKIEEGVVIFTTAPQESDIIEAYR